MAQALASLAKTLTQAPAPAKTAKPAQKTAKTAGKGKQAPAKAGSYTKQAAIKDTLAKAHHSESKPAQESTLALAQQQTPPAEKLVYGIRESYRPGAGRLLFAYTAAWLNASGMLEGASIPRDKLTKIAGSTAIGYHTTRTGHLVDTAGAIKLSATGGNKLMDRAHDAKDREAFEAMLSTGIPDGRLIKSAAAFVKLA